MEGGHGQGYWSGGWHYGIIRAIPIKGQKKGFAQVEILAPVWGWSDGRGKNRNGTPLSERRPRGYYRKPCERVWVNVHNLNEPGDVLYHGPRLKEEVKERKEEKTAQQNKADKKHRRATRA